MKFTVYDTATGHITRTGECPDDMLEAQAFLPGEASIEGYFDPKTMYWDGTAMQPKPASPGPGYDWDTTTKAWVPNLAAAKAAKWAEMKAARSAAEYGGFTYNNQTFDSDFQSTQRILGTVTMARIAAGNGQAFQTDWTLADNSVATLTGGQFIALGVALGQHVQAIYAQARARRAAIEAATTVEEVNAITWSTP